MPGSTWKRIGSAVLWMAAGVAAAPARGDVPPPDYDFQWANITDLNNPAYPGGPPFNVNAGRGSVSYGYRISKLEITTQQWADFLNMALRQGVNITSGPALKPAFWGASQSGSQFTVTNALQPVIGLNWRAGAYYCNWLNNGKQESWASCQSGAYDASTFGDLPDTTFTDQTTRSPGAKFWIPSLDEWLKAAHYDPAKGGAGGWWSYPYRSDSAPVTGVPGAGSTSAGLDLPNFGEFKIPLGSYTGAVSAYGLWDLSGGSSEWNEETRGSINGRPSARRADGSFAGDTGGTLLDHIQNMTSDNPYAGSFYGFRIAGQIPAPSVVTVAFVGSAGFLFRGRR